MTTCNAVAACGRVLFVPERLLRVAARNENGGRWLAKARRLRVFGDAHQ